MKVCLPLIVFLPCVALAGAGVASIVSSPPIRAEVQEKVMLQYQDATEKGERLMASYAGQHIAACARDKEAILDGRPSNVVFDEVLRRYSDDQIQGWAISVLHRCSREFMLGALSYQDARQRWGFLRQFKLLSIEDMAKFEPPAQIKEVELPQFNWQTNI
jgi:hypothetical protein